MDIMEETLRRQVDDEYMVLVGVIDRPASNFRGG